MSENLNLPLYCLEQIHDCLARLRAETGARRVLLIDISGQLIEENGSDGHLDSATLSALAAGEMSAARELARRVGGQTRPKAMLLEGNHRSIYFSEVDEDTFLLVVCDGSTSLGLLRLRIREAVDALKSVFQEAHAEEGDRLEFNLDRLICTEPQLFPQTGRI